MSLADKLNYLLETKRQIKEAIKSKGVAVSDADTFRSCANKILEIQSSGSSDELIKLRTINNELNLAYFFYCYPNIYANKISSANDLIQKVQNSAVNWCKNNNLRNIYNISNAFAGWNYGAQQYINYDLDISNWSFSEIVDTNNCFGNSFFRTIKFPNTIKVSNVAYMFSNTKNLVGIEGTIDISDVNNNLQYMFIGCSKLEKVYIKNLNGSGLKISESTNLKKEYLVYLLENAIVSETTRTINLGSTNLAKLTAEEIAVGTNKGYTIS